MKEAVTADRAPQPRGPYSVGVIASGRLLFVAGQLPMDPISQVISDAPFSEQAVLAFENLSAVAESVGASLDSAVKVNVYLRDIANRSALNEVYGRFFSQPYPARTTIQAPLSGGAQIEVDAVLALD